MKILVISHTYIAPINRDKWKTVAILYPNDEIKVVFPLVWPTHLFIHKAQNIENDNLQNCEFIALDTFKAGNEVLYGYRVKPLYRLLKGFGPDIIHVEQGDNAFSYFQVIFLKKLLWLKEFISVGRSPTTPRWLRRAGPLHPPKKRRSVYTKFIFFTWVNWQANFSLKYRLIWRWLEKFNLAHSSGAIVGNGDAQKILHAKNFTKPIQVFPQLGVNQDVFKPNPTKKSTKTIGFLGRLVPEKGVLLLLQVFLELKKTFPEWNLLIVGRGPEQEALEHFVRQNKIQDVMFAPPVSHYEMANLINTIDILVLPSYDTPDWKEQFGHILIEAMACAVPVIGSSAGEIPNVIQDAGLIFEQKNHQALLDSLKTLMQDESVRKVFGQKGLERVTKHYCHEAIAQATHKFWEEILYE